MTPEQTQHREQLTADYGEDWCVWTSDEGHWYAARHEPVAEKVGEQYGCVRTVHAPDPVQLRAELVDQTKRGAEALADLGML